MKEISRSPFDGSNKRKIRVGIVNYLNTKPLIYGLQKEPINKLIDLVGAYPAKLAQMLADDQIDVGLIPVAVIPQLSSYHINGVSLTISSIWCNPIAFASSNILTNPSGKGVLLTQAANTKGRPVMARHSLPRS